MTGSAPVLQVHDLTVRLPGGADRENAIQGVSLQVRVAEYGPVAEVFSRPRHAYTQALLDVALGKGWAFGQAWSRRRVTGEA
jgi:ABC-type dipeptide/oligopeptide/nickel transport system ATPase component